MTRSRGLFLPQPLQGPAWQELGKLGPDIDEERLGELRARQDRVREFAQVQRELANAKPRLRNPALLVNPLEERRKEEEALRQKRQEYVREMAARTRTGRTRGAASKSMAPPEPGEVGGEEGVLDPLVRELAARHEADAARVEAIRKEMGRLAPV